MLKIDGLYVLKMTDKKLKEENSLSIPSNLTAYIMSDFPPPTCPWSLSGPQFPQPTHLQQRYCYPKCDGEYASKKGGSLWTIINDEGKEDLTYLFSSTCIHTVYCKMVQCMVSSYLMILGVTVQIFLTSRDFQLIRKFLEKLIILELP